MFQLTLILAAPADTVVQVRIVRTETPPITAHGESAPDPQAPALVKCPANVIPLPARKAS